jgi:hypothetical protein
MAGLSSVLTLLFSVIIIAGFSPNVSVDHGRSCGTPSITLGPPHNGNQPVYVVMGDGQNVVFQMSADTGRTWLAENRDVCQGGASDVTTDPDGNIYILCSQTGHVCCVVSTDGGGTWSFPVRVDDNDSASRIGSASVAVDTANHLFCVWSDFRTVSFHVWSSVSTDRGATWSRNVRVDDDTTNSDCFHSDVYVQPGTNHYFEAVNLIRGGACLYRSQDMGKIFEPRVRLETSGAHTFVPHVVADRAHVICDYNDDSRENCVTKARTLCTPPDTWGPCNPVTDSSFNSYYCGALAISADGRVHTALMMNYRDGRYDVYSACSMDHGATWSGSERVNDDTTGDKYYPDIAADSAGHAYLVWKDGRESCPGIWFSTDNWSPNARHPTQPSSFQPLASVVRGVLHLQRPAPAVFSLLSSDGRKALELRSGANDVSRLSPGVYFVRDTRARSRDVSKVLVVR